MSYLEALVLGIIQGLTEFLPVSSSGHLQLGHALFGGESKNNLLFAIVVHGATVLSTLVVFRKDLFNLMKGCAAGEKTAYLFVGRLLISAIPVFLIGMFVREKIEGLYGGNVVMVGFMLLVTAILLALTNFPTSGKNPINGKGAFIIGVAQTLAVIPGISRSGATIATSILMGNSKEEATRFSFLMVLLPIIGANIIDIANGNVTTDNPVGLIPLAIGFISAFVFGLLACSWMIKLVKRGKLIYFAAYCFIIGLIAIFAG